MRKKLRYLISAAVLLTVFSVGFILGCGNKEKVLSANEAAKQTTAVMPDNLKGVHKLPAVGTIDVAFSPNGGVANMIVQELGTAKQSIEVQAYSFTNADIAKALVDAHKRGVQVRVILDKSQETEKYSAAKFLANAGIPVHIDRDFQIAHNKIMIIDNIDVITGSFNFTKAAEHANAENCLILHSNKQLVATYQANWQWRWNNTK